MKTSTAIGNRTRFCLPKLSTKRSRSTLQLCMATAVLLLIGAQAHTQVPKFPKIKQFGVDGFRLMLQQQGLDVTQTEVGAAFTFPKSTVLVVLGDLTSVQRISGQIEQFVNQGGALLYASDLCGKSITGQLQGVTIRSHKASSRSAAYRGLVDCPIIRDFDHAAAPSLLDGINSIVANIPSRLHVKRSSANTKAIAWLPNRRRSASYALMGIRYFPRGGRMLAVSDHSIFINEMLVHADNAHFASNVASWLCEDGERNKLVFINDGQILPAWGFGDTPPSIPLSSLIKAASRGGLGNLPFGNSVFPIFNQSLAQFQAEDGFNGFLGGVVNRLNRLRPKKILLFLLSGCALMVFGSWLLTSRKTARRFFAFQDWDQPTESKFAAALRNKQYHACIRMLARDFFYELGASDFDGSPPPKVIVRHASTRKQTRRNMKDLWRLATKSSRWGMSKRRYDKLLRVLNELRLLHQNGELSLE